MTRRGYSAIDLFSGAGGLAEGFRRASFHTSAANDIDPDAAATFQRNFPEAAFFPQPIEDLSADMLLEAACLKSGELDVLLGGPPCQAFSVYNHQRGFHDERSGLFREYLRIVDALRPRIVVIENVTGMKDLGDGRAIREIHERLEQLGYAVEHRILKAELYGVPQERRRIFFVASRVGSVRWPEATHGAGDDLFDTGRDPLVTVWEAIGDLPLLHNGEGTDELRAYTRKARTDYQKLMRDGSAGVRNHLAPQLAPINLRRLQHIAPGGSWRDLPYDLLPAGMKRARRSDHTKRYGRLHQEGLASTILTKCDPHWGSFFHPEQDRAITVREAARLQSFPDTFVFLGSRGRQYVQVGNAVPPLLAHAVAKAVRGMLRAERSSRRTAVAI